MYQPAHGRFTVADPDAVLAEWSAIVPATLVTSGPDGFRTSILPMLFDPTDGAHGVLRGHLARPNGQWSEVDGDGEGARAVAIFHGPDAYVSPSLYEEKARTGRVVPTWNYVVIVVHGTLITHDDTDWLLDHVRKLVDRHEAARPEPWSIDDAPDGYIRGQAKGIVGLELRIDRIEAKRKLSQNRSDADVAGVIEAFSTGTSMERAVAAAMRDPHDPVLHSRPHGGDREE
ncbi:MAG: FMN-binding negative transcriptional regulator [Chloroflexota bacterium]|nr:MAG: FMN-binding negative transcriptional regulator [Chloroflexota bacterium]